MKCKRDFCYNKDFEWYETEVFIEKKWISLFVPCYLELDHSLLLGVFSPIVSWVTKNKNLVESICVKRLSGHIMQQGQNPPLKNTELTLLSLSLEKENSFELLLECQSYQKYITLLFNSQYKLINSKIDF